MFYALDNYKLSSFYTSPAIIAISDSPMGSWSTQKIHLGQIDDGPEFLYDYDSATDWFPYEFISLES